MSAARHQPDRRDKLTQRFKIVWLLPAAWSVIEGGRIARRSRHRSQFGTILYLIN
jgi:hypothetical protein